MQQKTFQNAFPSRVHRLTLAYLPYFKSCLCNNLSTTSKLNPFFMLTTVSTAHALLVSWKLTEI